MTKTIIALAATLALGIAVQAGPSDAARIDVNPVKGEVALAPGQAEGGSVSNQDWVKDEAKRKLTLTSNFPASSDWKKGSMSFTPDKDGVVNIGLCGQWSKDPADMSWVLFDGVQAEGAEIRNGNFEDGAKDWWIGGKEKASIADVAKSGSKSVKVNHNNRATQNVEVKAGQPVVISFWYKLAE
jgi:nitrous oxidase accessory protein NosD